MLRKIILGMLFLSVIQFAKSPQEEVITKTFTAEKRGTLEVKLNPGEVNVKTWDKNEVLVKIDGLDDEESKDLRFEEKNGSITVEYEGKWGWGKNADYYFTVPKTYNLDISTTGGGILVQDDIDGNVKVQTMGGDLKVSSVTGDASLETMGGDIKIGDVEGTSYISTQGGDITIGNLKGNSREVKTMGGDITINSVNRIKKITTYGGDIKINSAKQNLEVTTFGGNINVTECSEGVKANTYGGNIMIHKANGLVDVSSGGGNITLKNITGSVRARTGAGDIHIELTTKGDHSSDIRTPAGDIELIVGSGSKMTIDAEVNSYWGDRSNVIKSDFEGSISSDRNETKGTFRINGGGAEVKLRVNNGTITIQKQ